MCAAVVFACRDGIPLLRGVGGMFRICARCTSSCAAIAGYSWGWYGFDGVTGD